MAVAGVLCGVVLAWSAWALTIGGAASPDETDDAKSDEAADGPSTTTSQPTTTTESTAASEQLQLGPMAAPILGEEVGYDLIVATNDRPAILDLDSGAIRYAEGSRADPLTVTGHWLIANRNDKPFILDLDDLEADPIQLPFPADVWLQLADSRQRDDGLAWFQLSSPDSYGPSVILVNVGTGEVVEEVARPEGAELRAWFPIIPFDGSTLLATPTGGVYEAQGGDVRQVADGYLLVADDRRVLVTTCDDRLRCTMHWLDRETWQPVDLAVPEEFDGSGRFVNGTDWAVLFDFNDLGPRGYLFNVVTGRRVELPEQAEDPFLHVGHGIAVSPDGRWLATASTDEVQLMELATGREIVVTGLTDVVGPAIFYEPSS
jgi:hypothetical protein